MKSSKIMSSFIIENPPCSLFNNNHHDNDNNTGRFIIVFFLSANLLPMQNNFDSFKHAGSVRGNSFVHMKPDLLHEARDLTTLGTLWALLTKPHPRQARQGQDRTGQSTLWILALQLADGWSPSTEANQKRKRENHLVIIIITTARGITS